MGEFWRNGTLFAQGFDPGRRALVGEPEPIAAPVSYTQNEQVLATVSGDGTLVYRSSTSASPRRWTTRGPEPPRPTSVARLRCSTPPR